MLRILLQQEICTITHRQYEYVFTKDFLTSPLWSRLHQLPIQPSYPLTPQQSLSLSTLFKKIETERNSSYAYTKALQQTYLIELIHFILKLN